MRYGGEVDHRDSKSAPSHPRGAADPSVRRWIPAATGSILPYSATGVPPASTWSFSTRRRTPNVSRGRGRCWRRSLLSTLSSAQALAVEKRVAGGFERGGRAVGDRTDRFGVCDARVGRGGGLLWPWRPAQRDEASTFAQDRRGDTQRTTHARRRFWRPRFILVGISFGGERDARTQVGTLLSSRSNRVSAIRSPRGGRRPRSKVGPTGREGASRPILPRLRSGPARQRVVARLIARGSAHKQVKAITCACVAEKVRWAGGEKYGDGPGREKVVPSACKPYFFYSPFCLLF
jgi:hypothetical protein